MISIVIFPLNKQSLFKYFLNSKTTTTTQDYQEFFRKYVKKYVKKGQEANLSGNFNQHSYKIITKYEIYRYPSSILNKNFEVSLIQKKFIR